MNINIAPSTKNSKYITLTCPFSPRLPEEARQLGGKWTGEYWYFDARDEQRVRDMAIRIYGTDGTSTETVTVRVCLSSYNSESEAWVCGRQAARRASRDYAVRLGDGCVLISGKFMPSGGSAKYPRLGANDAIVLVRDVPRAIAEAESASSDNITIADEREGESHAS